MSLTTPNFNFKWTATPSIFLLALVLTLPSMGTLAAPKSNKNMKTQTTNKEEPKAMDEYQDKDNPTNMMEEKEEDLEFIQILGSRQTTGRPSLDSPVPIDIFSKERFSMVGSTADITDNLNTLLPSYLATPATGDGSAFVRPTSLRGMAGDQTLVMVNGRRRHRSALVQLFAPPANNGSHGVDVAMIPSIALKRVEVLRDGASAQYGSDAIAGVINLVLNDSIQKQVEMTYGQHFEGEANWKIAATGGVDWDEDSFLNLSIETNDNQALSRGHQHSDAPAGVDDVGADSPFGDAPLVQTWGRPETIGTRFVFNSMHSLRGNKKAYLFGNFAQTKGRFRFFYRTKENDALKGTNANATNLRQAKAVGFTPYLDGEQTDMSLVTGFKGTLAENNYDISMGYGSNNLDYTLYNSLNPKAPLKAINDGQAQRNFDTGDFSQSEFSLNVDLSRQLSEKLHIASGLEYRNEAFNQMAAETNAHLSPGSSGMIGTKPEDAGKHSRSNYALYGDLEYELNSQSLLQTALRFENFSDFGTTINGKVAGRYDVRGDLTLRGAISTGFHAPTPGQSNQRSTTTSYLNGERFDVGHFPAGHEEVKEFGSKPLTEETSLNLSLGLVYEMENIFTLTADYYNIGVAGRIYRANLNTNPNQDDTNDTSFYTNVMDLNHSGIDLTLSTNLMDLVSSIGLDTDIHFSYNMNSVEVTKNRMVKGKQVVSDEVIEDIENNYPSNNFTLTTYTPFMEHWSLLARGRYIGSHYDQSGRITNAAPKKKSKEIDSSMYFDIELSYMAIKDLTLSIGGTNIFDSYPTKIKDDGIHANMWKSGMPYPRRSATNYEGGAWYMKAAYMF